MFDWIWIQLIIMEYRHLITNLVGNYIKYFVIRLLPTTIFYIPIFKLWISCWQYYGKLSEKRIYSN